LDSHSILYDTINGNARVQASGARAAALTFFGIKIPLQAVYFEEKIHHKVAKVEKGREKRGFVLKLFRLF
jgi:hypothetical protein